MHEELGLLSQGKASSHSTALLSFFVCVQMFRVSTPPAVRLTLLRQRGMGSLTCAQPWVRAVYTEGGSGTNKSAQELTRGDIKIAPYPPPGQGIESTGLRI